MIKTWCVLFSFVTVVVVVVFHNPFIHNMSYDDYRFFILFSQLVGCLKNWIIFHFFLFHHHRKCYFPSTLMCMANCLDIFFGKHVQFFSQKKHQNLRKMVNLTASYLIWFFFSVRFSCYFKKLFWHYWLVGWLVGWQIFFNILFFSLG